MSSRRCPGPGVLLAGIVVSLLPITGCSGDSSGDEGFAPVEDPPPDDEDPPPMEAPRPETALERCERRASTARPELTYEPERSMVVGQSYGVPVHVSLGPLDPDVTFETPTTVEVLDDIHCQVSARLAGVDFEIDPEGLVAQSFADRESLGWTWRVRPTEPGQKELTLTIQATVVDTDGRDLATANDYVEAVIDVDAAPVSIWRRSLDGLDAAFGNEAVRYVLPGGGSTVALAWIWRRFARPREAYAPRHLRRR